MSNMPGPSVHRWAKRQKQFFFAGTAGLETAVPGQQTNPYDVCCEAVSAQQQDRAGARTTSRKVNLKVEGLTTMNTDSSPARAQNAVRAVASTEQQLSQEPIHPGGTQLIPVIPSAKIVIVDSQTLTRDCLARCLKALEPNLIVSAFASLPEWQKAEADHQPPSIIVLFNQGNDETYPELEILSRDIPVIVVSHDEDFDQVLLALQSGVRGYIPTSMTFDVAVEAMRLVRAGGTFVPASSLNSARQKAEFATARRNGSGPFSPRQTEVIEAVRQGKANKVIAYELNMRESTVKVHIRHIMRKLKATNRTQVAYMTNHLFDQKQLRSFAN